MGLVHETQAELLYIYIYIHRHAQPSITNDSPTCLMWTVPGTSISHLYAVWGPAGDQENLHKCVQHPPSFQNAMQKCKMHLVFKIQTLSE